MFSSVGGKTSPLDRWTPKGPAFPPSCRLGQILPHQEVTELLLPGSPASFYAVDCAVDALLTAIMPLVSSSVEDSAFSSPVKDQAIEEEQLVAPSPHLSTVVQWDPGPPLHRPFT